MTALLAKAFEQATQLPDMEQNALAKWFVDQLQSKKRWSEAFAESEDVLEKLADEAIAGKTARQDNAVEPRSPMNSFSSTDQFWKRYSTLPSEAKKAGKRNLYALCFGTPIIRVCISNASIRTRPVFSVGIGIHYRAVGCFLTNKEITWFWIGSHAEYDRLVRQLRKS